MTEELFQTYDETGRAGPLVARSRVHREGLWHRAANVLLFRPNGTLILQQRAASKDVCPGRWDLSAAEHLKPGETFIEAAARGLIEELGLHGVELEPACSERRQVFEADGVLDREMQQTFRGATDASVVPDPAEVADVREVSLTLLAEEMDLAPEQFTPWFLSIAHACRLFE